jgi:hypothetical protein
MCRDSFVLSRFLPEIRLRRNGFPINGKIFV